ncbi:MAG TPA: Na+/H+ antiporter NhaA [Ferruginibacter sp.]|nr:Na+/H+ antiporter NhaA [Ferruginibacter sp.]
MQPVKILRNKIIDPFIDFINDSRSVGVLLLLCTLVSLVLSNTPFTEKYFSLINFELPTNSFIHLPHNILHWINDGLMAVFFFLAGIEIKREITQGELSSFSTSILPVVSAIGGMVVPAAIYFFINKGTRYEHGWGIPMATDIAFSLGIAALLGKRVPLGLKVFLTALAIIDDLGAIVAIAIFYTSSIHWMCLGFAAIIIASLYLLLRLKIFGFWNFALGILLWYCFLNSGIHATIAGVIFAFLVPVNAIEKIEHSINKPVNFLIIPLFALANTAILFPTSITMALSSLISWGIIIGLIVGKPLGIILAAYTSVKLKFGNLPSNTNWLHIIGAGILAGIGFTMSIFIATLAFETNQVKDIAKIAVLAGSFLSIALGIIWFRLFCKPIAKQQ